MIRENLLPHLGKAGGFYVQRVFIGDRYAAFKLNPLREAAEYRLNTYVAGLEGMDSLFLYSDEQGQWHKDLRVFADSGREYLKKSLLEKKEIILLDELGGVELGCPDFMEMVLEVIDSDIPTLGVLKSPRNVERLNSGLGNRLKSSEPGSSALKRLKDHPQMELLTVTATNYHEICSRAKTFVKEALKKNR